jgi:hypothetical protein
VPIGMVRSNYKKSQQSDSTTELIEYPGRGHFQMAQDGWEKVAANIIAWVEKVDPAEAPTTKPKASRKKVDATPDPPIPQPVETSVSSEAAGTG